MECVYTIACVTDYLALFSAPTCRDTTRPPEKGVKYVCCGGCRQWLMAPRDAVYVVCSTCDSINNCNLAPKVQYIT
jgi:LSD1 subclass zinc finger protein